MSHAEPHGRACTGCQILSLMQERDQARLALAEHMLSAPTTPTPEQRSSAARIRMAYDKKRGVTTPGWIASLAEREH